MNCEHCDTQLPWTARSDARFCSTRCRVAHHRTDRIPADLRSHDRWLRHDTRKVPLSVTGRPGSSTNPTTWTDYTTARSCTIGDGLGFALNGDGIVCIDLDHCIGDGALASWAERILALAPATYIELSPSGTGLHIWGYAKLNAALKIRDDDIAIEIYGNGRYMTVTGKPYHKAPSKLADLTDLICAASLDHADCCTNGKEQ